MTHQLAFLERLSTKYNATHTELKRLRVVPLPKLVRQPSRRGLRIESFYNQVVTRDLVLQTNARGGMGLPRLNKVVINTTSKRFAVNRRELTVGLAALFMISGQRGQPTTAHKSIAAFKLRQGASLGCKVTLRGNSGYSALDKFVTFVFPRGGYSHINKTVDKGGNWGVGISNPLLFVELENQYDLFRPIEGMGVSIVLDNGGNPVVLLVASSLQLLAL